MYVYMYLSLSLYIYIYMYTHVQVQFPRSKCVVTLCATVSDCPPSPASPLTIISPTIIDHFCKNMRISLSLYIYIYIYI